MDPLLNSEVHHRGSACYFDIKQIQDENISIACLTINSKKKIESKSHNYVTKMQIIIENASYIHDVCINSLNAKVAII